MKAPSKAEIVAERDYWKKLAEEGLDPRIKSMRLEDGHFDMAITGPIVEMIAVAFVGQFKEGGGTNFMEMSLFDRDEPFQRYTLTVQKVGKLSPTDKCNILEEALKRIAASDRAMFASEEPINAALSALAMVRPTTPVTPTTPIPEAGDDK